jgi:putrescine aminotransferase
VTEADWDTLTDEVIEKYQKHLSPGLANLMRFGGFGALEVEAEGCLVRDGFGHEYIDCLGGYGLFSLGHRHPKVVAAVRDQLDRMPLSTRTFFNQHQAELAERLATLAPKGLQYSFFCHSGAEAVEGALKAARAATGRPGIVSTEGAFHGKTMGALSASGRPKYKQQFEPLVPGFTHVPYGDAAALEAAVNSETAAVILEPIQGEGGVIVPPDGYLTAARGICDRAGALLILDEVQTGLGRTGRMFAAEWEGVSPDLMTLAKALGGGVESIGAFMGTAEVWEKLFGENPTVHTTTVSSILAYRAALATLDVLEEERLPQRALEVGERLAAGLRQVRDAHPNAIKDVRGRGLLLGVEFHHEDYGLLTIGALAKHGVIVAYTLNNPKVMRFEPPLIISESQVGAVISAFEAALTEAEAMLSGILV